MPTKSDYNPDGLKNIDLVLIALHNAMLVRRARPKIYDVCWKLRES